MEEEKKEISVALQKDLLAYLSKRPYIEVASLIVQLGSLKKKNDSATLKK
mgnify:CR=1 FL=1|jgi:hypothetical protein